MIKFKNRKMTKEEAKEILKILRHTDVNCMMTWATKANKERTAQKLTVEVSAGKVGDHTVDLRLVPEHTWSGWELSRTIYIDGKRRYSKTLCSLLSTTYDI